MRRIPASPVTQEAFAPFGRVIDLTREQDPEVIETAGPRWVDHYTKEALLREIPSLGRTLSSTVGDPIELMERHEHVGEAIVPAGAPVVLTVTEPTAEPRPRAEAARSFIIAPGTVVVMNPGVWHAECAGIDGPTPYYWLASCRDAGSSPWTPIEGGPVRVDVAAEADRRGA